MQIIEILAAGGKVGIVLLPGSDGVLIYTGGKEDRFPELLHGGAGSHAGEYLLCPGRTGDGGNAPLLLIFPAVHIGLQNGIRHSSGLGHFLHVDSLHPVGIFGNQMDASRDGFAVVFLAGFFPLLDGAQILYRTIAVVDFVQGLIVPLDGNLGGLCLVGLFHHHLNELRLIQVCINDDSLPLLHVGAAADDQIGILAQNGFIHTT